MTAAIEGSSISEPTLALVYSTIWSTGFLRHCRRMLTPTPSEEFYWTTGIEVCGIFVPLCLAPVAYTSASAAGVVVDGLSNMRQLMQMDKHGHRPIAPVHSHPGRGAKCVTPSRIDYSMQRRFERAGYVTHGVIFSRDGFIRAFSWELDFEMQVYGNGIEQLDRNLFRLTPISHATRTAHQA